jgi:hypothetical protein
VALCGGTALVGAPLTGADNAGAAHLFERDPDPPHAWSHAATLLAPDSLAGDELGISVALDGDWAAVGAWRDDAPTSNSGSVRLFRRAQADPRGAGGWAHARTIVAPVGASGDIFGFASAMDGGALLVGAPFDDDAGSDSGAAFVFERDAGGVENWGFVATLLPEGHGANDRVGFSASLHAGLAAVGAPGDSVGGTSAGSVSLFERDAGAPGGWRFAQRLFEPYGGAFNEFGISVGTHEGAVVAGSYSQQGDGAAHVFRTLEARAGTWRVARKLVASDAGSGSFLGLSCALGEAGAIVGALAADGAGPGSGAAYYFDPQRGPCPDVSGDGMVSASDLGALVGVFGRAGPYADVNLDGVVNTADLGLVLVSFGASCGP